MSASVTTQNTPAAGVTEIMARMVAAGWTHEASANPVTITGTDYYVLKSSHLLNAIGQDYWVMIYNPNGTNFIRMEIFESFVSTPTKQFWAPSSGSVPDVNGHVNVAAQTLDYTTAVGFGVADCGSIYYTLVAKATIDYVVVATQYTTNRSAFYVGSYIPYSWNTETFPLILTNCIQCNLINNAGGQSFPPNNNSPTQQGSALTRERFNNSWANGSGNFTGSFHPLKILLQGSNANILSGSKDGFNSGNFIGLDVIIKKTSSSSSGGSPALEVLLGKYRDIYDFGGIYTTNIGDILTVGGTTYYAIGAAGSGSMAADLYVNGS